MKERWTLEYDNGNIYVKYLGDVKAHFWDWRLAKEYLKFKTGKIMSLPKLKKPKSAPKPRAHTHECPRCHEVYECEERNTFGGCGTGRLRYCPKHTVLRNTEFGCGTGRFV